MTHTTTLPGWKLVPLEPTPEIIAGAAIAAWPTATEADIDLARKAAPLVLMQLDLAPGASLELIAGMLATMAPAYRAMLAAAPTAPAETLRTELRAILVALGTSGWPDTLPTDPDARALESALRKLINAPAAPMAQAEANAGGVDWGLEIAALFLDRQREAHDREYAHQEWDTGAWVFDRPEQEEYSNTLDELAEGIRALKNRTPATTAPVAPQGAKSQPTPNGWKLIPIEPTEDMVTCGFESWPDRFFSKPEDWTAYEAMTGCQKAAHRARLCWAAMLAAAPVPDQVQEQIATAGDAGAPAYVDLDHSEGGHHD